MCFYFIRAILHALSFLIAEKEYSIKNIYVIKIIYARENNFIFSAF